MNKLTSPATIDHFIQLDILRKLLDTSEPQSFSHLKDPAIDNSLFSYHMNKLINRQLVEKNGSTGYKLTSKGARLLLWTNEQISPTLEPRHLINFYVTNENNEVLITRRKGAAKDLLNTHLLPGGMSQYGNPQPSTIENLSNQLFGSILSTEYVCLYECIVSYKDGFVSHRLISLYKALEAPTQLHDDARYESAWVSIDRILSKSHEFADAPFIEDIVNLLGSGQIPPFISRSYQM